MSVSSKEIKRSQYQQRLSWALKNQLKLFSKRQEKTSHVNEDCVLEDLTSALMLHIWDP